MDNHLIIPAYSQSYTINRQKFHKTQANPSSLLDSIPGLYLEVS